MDFQVKKLDSLTIIIVRDKLNHLSVDSVLNAIDDGFENVILDLRNCSEVKCLNDINIIKTLKQTRSEIEKSLVLCGVNSQLLEHIDNKFNKDFFNIVPTRNEAVDMVYMEEQERHFFR